MVISSPTRSKGITLDSKSTAQLSRWHPGNCLQDNCGSITPGVLKSCGPHLSKLSSFTLGLSYTITDDDAFEFFSQLEALSSLDFRYYLVRPFLCRTRHRANAYHRDKQLRVFSVRPKLPILRSLTVRHDYLKTKGDATYLTRWIRWLSSRSPLEEFTLAIDRRVWLRPPTISLDSLADHLGLRHGQTLRNLDIRDGYISQHALTELSTRCQDLQILSIGTTVNVLVRTIFLLPIFLISSVSISRNIYTISCLYTLISTQPPAFHPILRRAKSCLKRR